MLKHGENVRRAKGPGVLALIEDRVEGDGIHCPA